MEIKTVGVIGAGVMGVGVAQNLAQTGHQVVLIDISENVLVHAKQEIRVDLRKGTAVVEVKRKGEKVVLLVQL